MERLLDKLNTPMAVVAALVLVVSANGFLYFYYSQDSTREPIVEEVQVLPHAEASSDTPEDKEPNRSAAPIPQKKRDTKADEGKDDPKPRRSEAGARKDRPHTNGDVRNEPPPAQEAGARARPAPVPSVAPLEEAPPVEASVSSAESPQVAPSVALAPATAPPSEPAAVPGTAPATESDVSTSEDYGGAGQGTPDSGGIAPQVTAAPATKDVSSALQSGVN